MAFADLTDDMDVAEAMIKYIINYVLENAPEEMEFFNKFMDKGLIERLQNIVNSDFERVTYTEAVEILQKSGEGLPVSGRVGYRPADGARKISDRRNVSRNRFSLQIIRRKSRRSICVSTMTARRSQPATCWFRALARSSAEAREKNAMTSSKARMEETGIDRGRLLVVHGSAQVRRRKTLRLRPWLRTDHHVYHRHE